MTTSNMIKTNATPKQIADFVKQYGRQPQLGDDLTLFENKIAKYSLQQMIRFGEWVYRKGGMDAVKGEPAKAGKVMQDYFQMEYHIDLFKQLTEGSK